MKNNKRILALLLALVMVMTLFVGCGKQEEPVEEPVEEPAEEVQDQDHSAEEETAAPTAEKVKGHHVNAHGMESFSIHYSADGSTFDYMNEAGELVAVPAEDVDAYMEEVIATCEDYTLNNRMMNLCYQEQYYQTYQSLGFYIMLMMDTSKPLDEQVGGDGVNTWQYSFVDAGIRMFHRMAATITEAKASGFDTTECEEAAASARKELEAQAEAVGYTDMDKFVSDSVAPGITMEDYMTFYEMRVTCEAYAEYLQEQVEVTEEEIDTYWAENEETLTGDYGLTKVDKNVVDVRHILIAPEETTAEDGTTSISDEAWAEAEAKANEIYEQWKSGEATEESFAELVPAHTEDPGSAETGGLYEDVYPGQMLPEFNDWCFEDGRKVGDHTVVKTDYGYHIMFFSGEGDYVYWRKSVKDLITSEQINNQLAELEAKYPMESDLSKVIILEKTAPTIPTEETEEETPVVEEHVHTEGDGQQN